MDYNLSAHLVYVRSLSLLYGYGHSVAFKRTSVQNTLLVHISSFLTLSLSVTFSITGSLLLWFCHEIDLHAIVESLAQHNHIPAKQLFRSICVYSDCLTRHLLIYTICVLMLWVCTAQNRLSLDYAILKHCLAELFDCSAIFCAVYVIVFCWIKSVFLWMWRLERDNKLKTWW